jgi:hypothetical protein
LPRRLGTVNPVAKLHVHKDELYRRIAQRGVHRLFAGVGDAHTAALPFELTASCHGEDVLVFDK